MAHPESPFPVSLGTLALETLSHILRYAIVDRESVGVVSRVCHGWHDLVYSVISWPFEGYLPITLVETFPSLAPPKGTFLYNVPQIGESSYGGEHIETGDLEEFGDLVAWVRRRGVRTLRLRIVDPVNNERVFEFFEALYEAGVRDLLVYDSHTIDSNVPSDIRSETVCWYQEGWREEGYRGTGRLVTANITDDYLLLLPQTLSPNIVHVYLHNPIVDSTIWEEPILPSCVKILSLGSTMDIRDVVGEEVEEIRLLISNPLDEEVYGPKFTDPEYESPHSTEIINKTVRSIRGAIPYHLFYEIAALFPNVELLHLSYEDPSARNRSNRALIERTFRDPRARPWRSCVIPHIFFTYLPDHEGIWQTLLQCFDLVDLTHFTQVVQQRSNVVEIPLPRLPASVIQFYPSTSFRSSHLYARTHEDVMTIGTYATYNPDITVSLASLDLFKSLIAILKTGFPRSPIVTCFRWTIDGHPNISIDYDVENRKTVIRLPMSYKSEIEDSDESSDQDSDEDEGSDEDRDTSFYIQRSSYEIIYY